MERLAGLLYQKGETQEAVELQESASRGGSLSWVTDYRPHVARTKAKLGKNTKGQSVAVEVVQWQDGSTDVGDSNRVMQSTKDRYLY
ncbi:hypothetical protein CTRI78_v001326 [Colletotrichum trifolii]|uniref:Uncharacterized protein n=1 Tax=Colletotrichum trifolii TaxID=5466 RepID=A0A4V3HXA5_COLTR|nr:hypothetical protein CTRI78_v001326 [Colletotrichum trifolii]